MTDQNPISVDAGSKGNTNLIYILYLVGCVFGPAALVGIIMAYLGKGKGDALTDNHSANQINIFWKFVLYMVVSMVLAMVVVGILTMLAAIVWFVIRNIKGMQALSAGQPVANPGSWLL